jgi:E3 ubiquitin-protein ligase BRE1
LDKKKAEIRKSEEALVKSKKELEKQAVKQKASQSLTGSQKEQELQDEVDKCMV